MNKKKAVVIGGCNGIGLAVVKEFISRGYFVEILDIATPDFSLEPLKKKWNYTKFDLLRMDESFLESLSNDECVDSLMITAGFGRVADFEYLHNAEIEKLIKVNTIAAIKSIRIFYRRLKSNKAFYCGMMGSIAGFVSSPMFSVYAASKAAICRFIESVNIELEEFGTQNRILNVSPGSIQGTKFNGALENDIALNSSLAADVLDRMQRQDELFIPQYEEVYKGVLERYRNDPHEFGLNSYLYKKNSGRVRNEKKAIVGYLSGTFDLFHIGHLNLLRRAKEQCDYLIVGVHPNAAHKGKVAFIPFEERKSIVGAIEYVDKAVDACAEDSDAWKLWQYDRLFVGSDYKGSERFERYEKYFADKNVEIVYFSYTNGTSSTALRKALSIAISESENNISGEE